MAGSGAEPSRWDHTEKGCFHCQQRERYHMGSSFGNGWHSWKLNVPTKEWGRIWFYHLTVSVFPDASTPATLQWRFFFGRRKWRPRGGFSLTHTLQLPSCSDLSLVLLSFLLTCEGAHSMLGTMTWERPWARNAWSLEKVRNGFSPTTVRKKHNPADILFFAHFRLLTSTTLR